MPQPPDYNRLHNLTDYATANPSDPYNAAYVDDELNAIEDTLDQTLSNLTLIQRDDGALKNQIVTTDSLATDVAALMAVTGATLRGAWVTATAYALKDVVTRTGSTYICATAHTAGTFSTDLAAGKWIIVSEATSGIAANGVTVVPTGSIASNDVQSALAELDSEKLAKASNLSDLADAATAVDNLFAANRTLTKSITFSGARINEAKGSDVASASTIDLDAATGNLVDVTGTTAITAITLSAGREAVVRFTGVLTLTNGASLVLPSGANITTAAGDFAIFRGYAAGVVRCVLYTKATGQSLVATASYATFSAAVAANALTFTLPAGVPLQFSDGTVVTSNAITLTVSSGSTLGSSNGRAERIWLAAMKNSGTPELACINTWDGNNVYGLLPTDSISTTAEGGAGAADSAHTWYSTTARSSQPMCVLGYIEITEATAGTWATSPSATVGFGPGAELPGHIVQRRLKLSRATTNGTPSTPARDTTIPQSTEGTSMLTQTITPKSALNVVNVTAMLCIASANTGNSLSLFQDTAPSSATDARAVTGFYSAGNVVNASLRWQDVIGSSSLTTFDLRAGNTGGSAMTLNGEAGPTSPFSTGPCSTLEVLEIMR